TSSVPGPMLCCASKTSRRSSEHLVLIGLCLRMVFILVCHIMSFFPLPFLSPFFPFSEFTSLAGMHIWSLSSSKSSSLFFAVHHN
uniref:Uncharacterized protein n=1 Tax=Amazona collaria TaxID=241587 RepID=A0A8B9G7R8_9PSIT